MLLRLVGIQRVNMSESYRQILSESETLQLEELAIIKISEPISAALQDTRSTGTSNGSGEIVEGPSPASLEADLTHYKVNFIVVQGVVSESLICAGTFLKAALFLLGASHEGEVHTRYSWRPATDRRRIREQCS
jgi:hypothetical protein